MTNYDQCQATIRGIVNQINSMMAAIIELLGDNSLIANISSDNRLSNLISAIQGTALILCTLFFLLDFFSKSLHLQWVTWENVLMLFLKLFAAKVCVENSVWITDCIYKGLTSMVDTISGSSGFYVTSIIKDPEADWQSTSLLFVTQTEAYQIWNRVDAGFLNFQPVLLNMRIQIQGIIMQIIMAIANVIVLGRLFEIIVYTLIAPVPLSTLSCDGLTDVGKGFLKSFAAVSIQAIVLVIMFVAYSSVITLLTSNSSIMGSGFGGIILTLTLGLGVMQSGQWAKRICGAM